MRAEENECQRERRGLVASLDLAFNTLFGEGKHGSANLRTETTAEGRSKV